MQVMYCVVTKHGHLQRDFLAEKSNTSINNERLHVYCGAAELCIRFIHQFVVYIYAS